MATPLVGIQPIIFGDRKVTEPQVVLDEIQQAGYVGVESVNLFEHHPERDVKQSFCERGLVVPATHAGYGVTADPAKLEQTMDFLNSFGGRYLINSVIVATLVTAGQVFFSACAAYAFSRLHWPGRDVVCGFFLAGLMVPAIFTFLPNFVLIKRLGLVDTLLGIALPGMLMTPFAVFFLRQFFMNVPVELEEAARLDGTSKLGVFFRLIIPMSAAPLSTLTLLTYIASWNDYFWPLMVSYSDNSRLLTVGLGVFRSQTPQTGPDWSGLMAATLIAALPMLVLFILSAKRIVNSIGFSGIK